MLCNLSTYDSDVTLALKKTLEEGLFTPDEGEATEPRELGIEDLKVGQILDRSVETIEGQLLIRQGTVLGPGHLVKLANFALIGAITGPFSIRAADAPVGPAAPAGAGQ